MWPWSREKSAANGSNVPGPTTNNSHESTDELVGPLMRLRLQGYGPQNDGRHPFVGGFAKPATPASSQSGYGKPLPPRPPSGPQMPVPRPAQYPSLNVDATYPALPEPPQALFPLPTPTPILAVEALLAQPDPSLGPSRPLAHSAPTTTTSVPLTPQRRRRSSSATATGSISPPRASAGTPSALQCSATTKAGKRCANKVKASLPLTYIDGDAEELERYCHIHLKEALIPSGFYSRRQKSVWVDFDDWIPVGLSPETKAALRAEMEKAASPADADGYIYTFELRQHSPSADVHLKVGRTNNVRRRLHEWGKQCGKEVVPRGLWPAPADEGASMLIGRIRPGPVGPFAKRLERLIHLELADLAVLVPYLPENERPKQAARLPNRRSSSDGTGTAVKKPTASPGRPPTRPRVECVCGKTHQEIFMFQRARSGKYKDHIWEELVQPVIDRWGKFVEEHVALHASS